MLNIGGVASWRPSSRFRPGRSGAVTCRAFFGADDLSTASGFPGRAGAWAAVVRGQTECADEPAPSRSRAGLRQNHPGASDVACAPSLAFAGPTWRDGARSATQSGHTKTEEPPRQHIAPAETASARIIGRVEVSYFRSEPPAVVGSGWGSNLNAALAGDAVLRCDNFALRMISTGRESSKSTLPTA
jgi:hypothetical protein